MAKGKLESTTLWLHEPDEVVHQAIGKLGEEAAELSTIIFRSLIQGINGIDPKKGVPNFQALWEEIADVQALIQLVIEELRLPVEKIVPRALDKVEQKREWMRMIRTHLEELDRAGS